MAKSMSGPLPMSQPTMFEDSPNAISSPVLADGPTRSGSPAGPTTEPSGPEAAPVSHLAWRERVRAPTIRAIFGLRGSNSLRSGTLQLSLESRLRARMGCSGSIEFTLRWRHKTTPSGRQIYQLLASARRWQASAYSSWPRPVASEGFNRRKADPSKHRSNGIETIARLGWPRPRANERGGYQYDNGDHDKPRPTLTGMAKSLSIGWWSGPLQVGRNAIEAEVERGGRHYRAQWRIEPGLPLLAYGIPNRVEQLRGYGNAIVPQVAQAFIEAYLDVRADESLS
jgi:hypothetical protein